MNLLDDYFLEANPNPERIGCPAEDVIRGISENRLPPNHPARLHLASCSECFAEFKAFQVEGTSRTKSDVPSENDVHAGAVKSPTNGNNINQPLRKRNGSVPPPAPAPAVASMAEPLDFVPMGKPTPRLSAVLDLLNEVVTVDQPVTKNMLPRGVVQIKVLLSSSNAPGTYTLLFSQGSGDFSTEFRIEVQAAVEKDRPALNVLADLRSFDVGAAHLTIVETATERAFSSQIWIEDASKSN